MKEADKNKNINKYSGNMAHYDVDYKDKYDGIDPMRDTIREPVMMVKQNSTYDDDNRCAPDNNIFFEERSNPLSSKGN